MGRFFFDFEALRTESLRAGAGLVLEKLLKAEIILAAFPLHDRSELQACQSKWLVYWSWPWDQPFVKIKDYFGADSASVSERFRTSSCVDGVVAMPCRLDAVDVAVRESTRLVNVQRQFRDAVVRHRREDRLVFRVSGALHGAGRRRGDYWSYCLAGGVFDGWRELAGHPLLLRRHERLGHGVPGDLEEKAI